MCLTRFGLASISELFLEFVAQQSNIDDMKDGVIGNNPESGSELAQDTSSGSSEASEE